jgi:hypothetical protein
MATAFYRATFEKQGTGSALGWKNCGAASGAMLADQATLQLTDPTPDAFRKLTGDFSGGLVISQIGSVLTKLGVPNTVYDASDGYTFDKLVLDLKRGRFAVVNGDYGTVPDSLVGDRAFNGYHSEFWHAVTASGIVVGDPLCDGRRAGIPKGYLTYPMAVARKYVEEFDREVPGTGIHACIMDLKRLKARSGVTNVRADHTRKSAVIGTIKGATTLVWGGTVAGESIGGNNVWYRVWYPASSRIGYCHSSVVVRV